MQWTNLKDRQEFPRGPVVRTRGFHCWSLGSITDQGAKMPQAIYILLIYIALMYILHLPSVF